MRTFNRRIWLTRPLALIGVLILFVASTPPLITDASIPPPVNPQSNSVGLEGTIASPPPTQGATIATPSNGQSFTSVPITVAGLCPTGLLIKLFDNGVFIGSATCVNGSYSIEASLFNGSNQLTVIDYDALNQAGPTSATVTVSFNNANTIPGIGVGITLTSTYARLGVNPGSLLTWPIIISGGESPYAISVDWGDNGSSLVSQPVAGTFNITHTYSAAGVYDILVKATDTVGNVAYLQLVGVANGKISQGTGSGGSGSGSGSGNSSTPGSNSLSKQASKISAPLAGIIIGATILIPATTFILGRKHELLRVRRKLESGERPF